MATAAEMLSMLGIEAQRREMEGVVVDLADGGAHDALHRRRRGSI
jgi:hypothetical protein